MNDPADGGVSLVGLGDYFRLWASGYRTTREGDSKWDDWSPLKRLTDEFFA